MKRTLQIADLFCGAGGTSTGALEAVRLSGNSAELTAINHWTRAVETHSMNHPGARHLCASLDSLNPKDLFKEGQLDFLLASPECTHHSIARGGRPMNDQSRATAWCVVRWAEALLPKVIVVENVREFQAWGPIGSDGRPLASRKGDLFMAWVRALEAIGYKVSWRVLCAADFGAPTTRERLFVQAVLGRRRVIWPDPTHAQSGCEDMLSTRKPWVAAREVIDWSVQSPSIFTRKKPLSANTMKRIECGLRKYGLQPFLASWDHTSASSSGSTRGADEPLTTITTKARYGVCEPFLVQLRGTADRQLEHSARDLDSPVPTISAGGTHSGLVQPFLLPQQSGGRLRPVSEPAPTVATSGAIGLVEPFLVKFYGTGGAASLGVPMDTITCKDRFGLVQPIVMVKGEPHTLDIRFRMLQPHELSKAQSFPAGYRFSGNREEQVKQVGNAVPPALAQAIVRAHLETNFTR